jgi:hypothetical protein
LNGISQLNCKGYEGLKVFETRKVRIFGPKRDEMVGGWRKLHNEELHNLHSSPAIVRMIKSRRMRWTGHVTRIRRRGIYVGFWLESQMKRDH